MRALEVSVGVTLALLLSVTTACGTKRYLTLSKMAEAKTTVAQIGRSAVMAYDAERVGTAVLTAGAAPAPTRALCASAKHPVPASASAIKGMKYQSAPAEWDGSPTEGWRCLKFSIETPQYYLYKYEASGASKAGDSFTATANGDLNGDGVLSTFALRGEIDASGELKLAPLKETNPEE